jgi:hypothetical protein
MATITNLYIDQGSTFNSIVTLKNQDGTPMNLTGFTVKSQFRKSYKSSQAFTFTASVFDATTGRIRLQLPANTSSAVRAGRYLFDIEITSPSSEKYRALEGIVVISPEITQI